MTRKFSDVQTAAKLRDLFRKIAVTEIEKAIPFDDFGSVVGVDTGRSVATVQTADGNTHAVSYGFGTAPAVGDMVRITGRAGSRYIASGTSASATAINLEENVLPGGPLTGAELVEIVQLGQLVSTTTQGIADLGGFGTVQRDAYLDVSPSSIASGSRLDWVIDASLVTSIPSAGLLDLSTPTAPTVIADGYFTFDMFVKGPAVDGSSGVAYGILRGANYLLFGVAGIVLISGFAFQNYASFSFSYPCHAGDEIFVFQQNNVSGTHPWGLCGSVKSIT